MLRATSARRSKRMEAPRLRATHHPPPSAHRQHPPNVDHPRLLPITNHNSPAPISNLASKPSPPPQQPANPYTQNQCTSPASPSPTSVTTPPKPSNSPPAPSSSS